GFIGTFPTISPETYGDYSDFVVSGEAESFFLGYEGDYNKLEGVVKGTQCSQLDTLPFPDWSQYDMNRFLHYPFFGKKKVFPVLTSRGCSLSCKYYCAYPIMGGGKIRFRSVENVCRELDVLTRKYGAQAVLFRDPIFTIDRKRTITLCRELLKRKICLHWACETHPSYLDEELIDIMYAAGNRAVTIGVETRTADVLKVSKRRDVNEEHLKKIVALCEKKGIAIMAGYMFGTLGDTRENILKTIRYASQL
ncbi:MAG: radical SAM protein, partial [bacterium]|nr:radical SAM protein [bacterium]